MDVEKDEEDQSDIAQNKRRILKEVEEKRSLTDIIRTRQKNWIGHIIRDDSLQREIMEGRMVGKTGRERPRHSLHSWTG